MPDRTSISVDAWKRKLLDLSRRNKALNFRPTRASTVEIVDEVPAEVFQQLFADGKQMRFQARAPESAPETTLDHRTDSSGIDQLLLGDAAATSRVQGELPIGDAPENEDFVPYERSSLQQWHTDDILQTSLDPDKLDKNLRRLEEVARTSLEEQGVNTLFMSLAMLYYHESDDSDVVLRAPLVLLPVQLSRKSARAGYVVEWNQDDPWVNPSLVEYLRRSFGINLPVFRESDESDSRSDLVPYLTEIAQSISQMKRWRLRNDIYLTQFSFQKLVLYKDLEKNAEHVEQHPIIRAIIAGSVDYAGELPDEIRTMKLDDSFTPERTCQVVDADGSQLRALAAIDAGSDLVLIGPPGTGKSQTITNMIAQALDSGKSVLFVAEKMAALEVVHERLQRVGLSEFCLELHSTKANKRHVMSDIAATIDASLSRVEPHSRSVQRLPYVRRLLTEYSDAVHAPYGNLGFSPYRVFGELALLSEGPSFGLRREIGDVNQLQLESTLSDLRELSATQIGVGDPNSHPWRDSSKTYFSESELREIEKLAKSLRDIAKKIVLRSSEASLQFGSPEVNSPKDIATFDAITSLLSQSPGAPESVLSSAAWNTPPSSATEMIGGVRDAQRRRESARAVFLEQAITACEEDDISFVSAKIQGAIWWTAMFDGRFRRIRRLWRSMCRTGVARDMHTLCLEMENLRSLKTLLGNLNRDEAEARDLFGSHWKAVDSDPAELESYVSWVTEFRGACVQHGLGSIAQRFASQRSPDTSFADGIKLLASEIAELLSSLKKALGWPEAYLGEASFPELESRAERLCSSISLSRAWGAFESSRQRVAAGIGTEVLPLAWEGKVPWSGLADAFKRAFYQKWVELVIGDREPLKLFATMTHEQRVREFRDLDQLVLRENRTGLIAKLHTQTQARLREPEVIPAMTVLRRELARQRGHRPLRETLKRADSAIRAIKPCFMMSPTTAAQYLDGSEPTFDLVIFDEASQVPTEEAVGPIIRGKQTVVVGDPKQLPPTNFFAVMGGQIEPIVDKDGDLQFEDSESILEQFEGAGVPKSPLTWHYRSLDESLISFSNTCFYESKLMTFPSVQYESNSLGVQFEYVSDGIYEGSGLNRAEARRVVDAVVKHAQCCPELSLGVGTFNLRQQIAIMDEIEQRRRRDPAIEPFFSKTDGEHFFVKNLENIQGDERDVIFLSVTYAKGIDGKLRYRFGPLNAENGWRRLNVLVSRARRQMVVFSSIHGDEIGLNTDSRGASLLRQFLLFAETRKLDVTHLGQSQETESEFERCVLAELASRGLSLDAQVGVADYRIDFGVRDSQFPGRYVCGIECDGAAYHSSQTARDRDRLRQQVLEDRGWTLHRIWSTDWYRDKQGQADRILRLVDESRRQKEKQGNYTSPGSNSAVPVDSRPNSLSQTRKANEPLTTIRAGEPMGYVRPAASPYSMTPGSGQYRGYELLADAASRVREAILLVVSHEAPIHLDDLASRVAAMWGNRAGSRITDRILGCCASVAQAGKVIVRNEFVYDPVGVVTVRSRAEVATPQPKISPEEFREAVMLILRTGHAFPRQQLTAEVRSLFGFHRTGHLLEEKIQEAVFALASEGLIGEGSAGFVIRA